MASTDVAMPVTTSEDADLCDLSFSDDSDDNNEMNDKIDGGKASSLSYLSSKDSVGILNRQEKTLLDVGDVVVSQESKEESLIVGENFALPPSLSDGTSHVIGPKDIMEFVSCSPCWDDQCSVHAEKTTINEPLGMHTYEYLGPDGARKKDSLLSESDEEEDEDTDTEVEDILPGVLAAGVEYYPRRILVEGWLHKKGTGKDWCGSRAWKPRWARLCLANVEGFEEVDIPLLLISWYANSTSVSTVIVLDSTVVLPVDLEDKERWNTFRFEIRHASTRQNATIPTTRTFSAPKKARDAWVYAISQALLMHAKQKDLAKKTATMRAIAAGPVARPQSPPNERPLSPTFEERWARNHFGNPEIRPITSPPTSPPSTRKGSLSRSNSLPIPRSTPYQSLSAFPNAFLP